METETPNTPPILNIAWTRHAHLDAAAGRRTKAFLNIRRWIIVLGVLATFFAILTQMIAPVDSVLLKLVVKILLIATPILASVFAAFSTKFYSNGAWLIMRAASEEINKEIFFYRTILQKNKDRRAHMEKRLAEIQRQLFRSLGGEFSFEDYDGPIPPHYNPDDPDTDAGYSDLTGEEYFKFRLEHQLDWHNKKINQFKAQRRRMNIYIYAAGALGAVIAAWGEGLVSLWVALTASITAAFLAWQELRNVDTIIKNYSKVVMELTILYDHWHNLELEERTTAEFYKMVRSCEEILWAQNTEYIRSMQEALKDSDLEEEAGLINRVVKESVESAEQAKQAMADSIVDFTKETLHETEMNVAETFESVLGALAEEASSDVVQKELEAMSKAATDMVENVVEKASSFKSSLADIAKEFAHVDVGRDTTKEELNAILARFPKSNDVKG
jgi:hypothetical protein